MPKAPDVLSFHFHFFFISKFFIQISCHFHFIIIPFSCQSSSSKYLFIFISMSFLFHFHIVYLDIFQSQCHEAKVGGSWETSTVVFFRTLFFDVTGSQPPSRALLVFSLQRHLSSISKFFIQISFHFHFLDPLFSFCYFCFISTSLQTLCMHIFQFSYSLLIE